MTEKLKRKIRKHEEPISSAEIRKFSPEGAKCLQMLGYLKRRLKINCAVARLQRYCLIAS